MGMDPAKAVSEQTTEADVHDVRLRTDIRPRALISGVADQALQARARCMVSVDAPQAFFASRRNS